MRRSRMPRTIAKRAGPACAANPPTWWNNAQGLTPCDVYQAIMDKCGYVAPAITSNESYYPVAQAQLCMCNTIAYNLGSACQDCQRGTTDQGILFSTYVTGGDGCTVESTSLADTVTPTDDIPLWAFLDTSTQFWTYDTAQLIALNSTTSATATPTVSSTDITTTMAVTANPTFSAAPSGSTPVTQTPVSSSSKSINAGAIGGGVAGGVVLVLLVIGLLLFMRRRRARNARGSGVVGTVREGRNGSTSSESSLTESAKAPGSSSHYTPHSQMAQLHHNGSGLNVGSYSTSTTSALTTPVDAPAVPPIPREYATSTPARSLAASPTPSAPAAPAVQKVKRVPVRYSEDELAQAEEEARRAAQHHS